MKLYTEDQIKKAIKYGQDYWKMDSGEITPYVGQDEFIDSLSPFELTAEKSLNEARNRYPRFIENHPNLNAIFKWEEDKEFAIKQECFISGAEWIFESIKQQAK